MGLREQLDELSEHPELQDLLPTPAFEQAEQAVRRLVAGPSGSLLITHLSAGSMMTTPAMYLEGINEEDIMAAAASQTEGKPPSARSLWSETCKLFTMLAARAVEDALSRNIPLEVRTRNLESGKADVMALPAEITGLALELLGAGGDAQTQQASAEVAATLLLIALKLLLAEVDEEWSLLGATAYRRLYNELVGATALHILEVCPEGKQPKDVVQRLVIKRVKETARDTKALQDVHNS